MKRNLSLIQLKNVPIAEQLQLEEKLLRTSDQSYCIINYGSPKAIVMGISGKKELLLNQELVQKDQILVMKRFSGGGTVIIDEDTLFVTFILNQEDVEIPLFPEPIMRWTGDFYEKAWQIDGFTLRENDYVIHSKKCGGNAQYIRKNRFLHHTSFLFDFKKENMKYLLLPQIRPKYRLDRTHEDFLTKLKEHFTMDDSIEGIKKELVKRFSLDW